MLSNVLPPSTERQHVEVQHPDGVRHPAGRRRRACSTTAGGAARRPRTAAPRSRRSRRSGTSRRLRPRPAPRRGLAGLARRRRRSCRACPSADPCCGVSSVQVSPPSRLRQMPESSPPLDGGVRVAAALPQRRVQHARVARVHRQVGRAGARRSCAAPGPRSRRRRASGRRRVQGSVPRRGPARRRRPGRDWSDGRRRG